ncbi:MAG: zinc ribbon domain-containing protein [Planctomycetota bacterium]
MSNSSQSPNSIMLTASDMKAAIAFYVDICGFEVKESWPEGDNPMWANLDLNGQSVMLGCPMEPGKVEAMCSGNDKELAWFGSVAEEWQNHKPGVGTMFYLAVKDVDAFHGEVIRRGGSPATDPKTQFYGLRDFGIIDPTGYRLVFYSPVTMDKCQSCGMPLVEAKPGDMYCHYCLTDDGKLKPFAEVLEGTIQGYFMGMQKMERAEAEVAAKEMLAQMPAWNQESCA